MTSSYCKSPLSSSAAIPGDTFDSSVRKEFRKSVPCTLRLEESFTETSTTGNKWSSSARFSSPIQKKKRWEGASIRVTFWNLLRTAATLAYTTSRFTKVDFLFLRTSICPRYSVESAKDCRSNHSLTWTQSAALPSVLCGSRTKVAFIFLRSARLKRGACFKTSFTLLILRVPSLKLLIFKGELKGNKYNSARENMCCEIERTSLFSEKT